MNYWYLTISHRQTFLVTLLHHLSLPSVLLKTYPLLIPTSPFSDSFCNSFSLSRPSVLPLDQDWLLECVRVISRYITEDNDFPLSLHLPIANNSTINYRVPCTSIFLPSSICICQLIGPFWAAIFSFFYFFHFFPHYCTLLVLNSHCSPGICWICIPTTSAFLITRVIILSMKPGWVLPWKG